MRPISQILERPIITEKSVRASMAGRYTFRCRKAANKIEIRDAVEAAYEVRVASVNTMVVKGKTKRSVKGRPGKTADWKKAIVTLAPDSKDTRLKEIFEGA
ncbi:MAG TPA: 50S ribosomal protein L23 [Abditibacteriaceae bacterium]|jgi:large subunit ribosomal protein L23